MEGILKEGLRVNLTSEVRSGSLDGPHGQNSVKHRSMFLTVKGMVASDIALAHLLLNWLPQTQQTLSL